MFYRGMSASIPLPRIAIGSRLTFDKTKLRRELILMMLLLQVIQRYVSLSIRVDGTVIVPGWCGMVWCDEAVYQCYNALERVTDNSNGRYPRAVY